MKYLKNCHMLEIVLPGDEIGLDEDTSYLDDAVSTPSVPSSEPGAESHRVGHRLVIGP